MSIPATRYLFDGAQTELGYLPIEQVKIVVSSTGGIRVSGSFAYKDKLSSIGGIVAGGVVTIEDKLSSNGGIRFGGSVAVTVSSVANVGRGGLIFSGSSVDRVGPPYPLCQINYCGCNDPFVSSSGGIKAGGFAVFSIREYKGIRCGGYSLFQNNKQYSLLNCVVPLSTNPPLEVIQDLVCLEDNIELVPGVFCLPATKFVEENKSNVLIEKDSLDENQRFAISFWTIPDDDFKQRCLFTRGFNNRLDLDWSIRVSYTAFGRLSIGVNSNRQLIEEISSAKLNRTRWNHVALSYDGKQITYYLNGQKQGDIAVDFISKSAGNSIGLYEGGSYPTARMQELRIYNDAKNKHYFEREIENFCDYDNFVTIDEEEIPSLQN